MSTSSARLPVEKIQIECSCGKKYRVPATKAGKKITCKVCKEKVKVPREAGVSERSRGNILAELGIDPEAAEQAYKAEVERRAGRKKTYRCTRCEGEIGANELKNAYIQGELVCPGCRASDEVADRRAEREKEQGKGKAAVELMTDFRDPVKARNSAIAYGALFFFGIALPLMTLTSMRVSAVLVALVIAGIGASMVYRTRS